MGRTAGSGGRMVTIFSAQPGEEFDPVAQSTSRALQTDILKRRYANGEIDRENYLRRLSDLSDA